MKTQNLFYQTDTVIQNLAVVQKVNKVAQNWNMMILIMIILIIAIIVSILFSNRN